MRLSWTPGNTAREEPMRLSLTRFLLAFLLVATSIPVVAQAPALLAGKAPAAWTGFDDQQAVRSALLGRIYQALVDAGIEIPFPQQDLHLRGLPDGLADALSRRAAAADPAADVPPSAAPPADSGHGRTDRGGPGR